MQHPHPNQTTRIDRGTGPEDQRLVQAAMGGDRSAVDSMMQRLGCVVRFVFRLNRSMGYNLPTEALEDVVQQVYVALWPRLPDYAGTSALETWVYGFCRNCLRAEFRRRVTRVRTVQAPAEFSGEHAADMADATVGGQVRADSPAPDEHAQRMESLDLLHEELDRLSAEDREIVELRHLQDKSFEQIAKAKNLPPSTIKDRCYRSMDKIRMRLKRRYGRA